MIDTTESSIDWEDFIIKPAPSDSRRKMTSTKELKADDDSGCESPKMLSEAPDMFRGDSNEMTEEITESLASIEWEEFDCNDFSSEHGIDFKRKGPAVADARRRTSRRRPTDIERLEREEKEERERVKSAMEAKRKMDAYQWWNRLGTPSKKDMIKKLGKGNMAGVDLIPEDIELLPWNKEGVAVNVPTMMKWMSEVPTTTPSTHTRRKKAMGRSGRLKQARASLRNSRTQRHSAHLSENHEGDSDCTTEHNNRTSHKADCVDQTDVTIDVTDSSDWSESFANDELSLESDNIKPNFLEGGRTSEARRSSNNSIRRSVHRTSQSSPGTELLKHMHRNTRKLNAYNCWRQLGHPRKKDMLRRCEKGDMKEFEVTCEDVELLPWLAGGFTVNVPNMMEWMAKMESSIALPDTDETDTTTDVSKNSSRSNTNTSRSSTHARRSRESVHNESKRSRAKSQPRHDRNRAGDDHSESTTGNSTGNRTSSGGSKSTNRRVQRRSSLTSTPTQRRAKTSMNNDNLNQSADLEGSEKLVLSPNQPRGESSSSRQRRGSMATPSSHGRHRLSKSVHAGQMKKDNLNESGSIISSPDRRTSRSVNLSDITAPPFAEKKLSPSKENSSKKKMSALNDDRLESLKLRSLSTRHANKDSGSHTRASKR